MKQKGVVMLRIITGLLILIACSLPAFAQAAKGVDKQGERVRDSGSERTPAMQANRETGTSAGRWGLPRRSTRGCGHRPIAGRRR